VNAGCTVTVEKVLQMYADGRMDILTRGQRRFEILALNEENAWLEAEVVYFDDDDFAAPPAICGFRPWSISRPCARLSARRAVASPIGPTGASAFNWRSACRISSSRTPSCSYGPKPAA